MDGAGSFMAPTSILWPVGGKVKAVRTRKALLGAGGVALFLAAASALALQGWRALAVARWDPGHQQVFTDLLWWWLLASVWVVPKENRERMWVKMLQRLWQGLAGAVTVFVLAVIYANHLAFWKTGHFFRWEHVAFGLTNAGRLALHLWQTSSWVFWAFLLVTLGSALMLRSAARVGSFFLKARPAMAVLALGTLMGAGHWVLAGLAGGFPASPWAVFLPSPSNPGEPAEDRVLASLQPKSQVWVPAPGVPQKKPPVVFILVESLRRDLVEQVPEAIPFLRSLIPRSIFFDKAYAPSSHSDYGDVAIWYSIYPLRGASRNYWREGDPRRGRSAFSVFRELGYPTAYVSSQNEKWGNMIAWLKTSDVQYFFHSEDFFGETWENWDDLPGLVGLIRSGVASAGKVEDSFTLAQALRWLDSLPEGSPFFLGINLQNTHFNYVMPKNAEEPFQPSRLDFPTVYYFWPKERVREVRNRYLNAVWNVDRLLAQFAQELDKRGLWRNGYFVVLGDNGEAFYEHGFGNHSGPMYEEAVRTLALIKPPEGIEPRVVGQPINLIDVVPGLLDLMGVPPVGDFQGVSPFRTDTYRREVYLHSNAFVVQDGIVEWPWKLLLTLWPEPREELYNLAEDPAEKQNVAHLRPEVTGRLREKLRRWRRIQLQYNLFPQNWQSYYPPKFVER